MALEGFINIDGTLIDEAIFGKQKVNCTQSTGSISLAELCLSMKAISFLENSERSNKRVIQKQENGKEVQFINSLGLPADCSIHQFVTMMSKAGKGITTQVELRISHPHFQEDYVLSTTSKKEFKTQLQKLLSQ